MTVESVPGQFVQVPEGRIHYIVRGSGPPLLLFHGLGTSVWAWHAVMDPLVRRYTCYALDMLGHGHSDKPRTDFAIPDFARAVDHAMEALGIVRAHVMGVSMGGVLAAELAASYPSRVDRLVLVGTPVRDRHAALDFLKADEANYDDRGMPLPRTVEDLKAATTFANPLPEWAEKMTETRTQAGEWVRKCRVALTWYNITARLPHIRASATLVLNGELDRLRDGEDVLRYNIANSSKVVMPGLAHYPQVDDPEAFVSVVLPFLETGVAGPA